MAPPGDSELRNPTTNKQRCSCPANYRESSLIITLVWSLVKKLPSPGFADHMQIFHFPLCDLPFPSNYKTPNFSELSFRASLELRLKGKFRENGDPLGLKEVTSRINNTASGYYWTSRRGSRELLMVRKHWWGWTTACLWIQWNTWRNTSKSQYNQLAVIYFCVASSHCWACLHSCAK